MSAKKQISLLPDSHRANTFTSRLIDWITSVVRVVIILTEFFVVAAFLSRFWLDRQNSDLSEKIRQQKAILTSTASFEKEYIAFQDRLNVIADLDQHPNLDGALKSVFKSVSPGIYFTKLSTDPQHELLETKISVRAYSSQAVIDFVTNLILNKNIKKLTVSSIEKTPKTSFYSINLVIDFNNQFVSQK